MYTKELKEFAKRFVSPENDKRTYCIQNRKLVEELRLATNFLPDTLNNVARAFCVIDNITTIPVCAVCERPCPIWNYQLQGFKRYCSPSCQHKCEIHNKKRRQTIFETYGTEHPLQNNKVKQKKIQTTLERYGVQNPSQNDKIKQKKIQTTLERYGVQNALQNNKVKQKKIQTTLERYGVENAFQSNTIKQQIKQSNLQKYGVENPSQNNTVKQKKKQTSLRNYNVEHPCKHNTIKQKKKQTLINNYNVENPSQNNTVKQKKKQTSLKNYGVEHPSKSIVIQQQKIQNNIQKYGVEHSSQKHICLSILTKLKDKNWLQNQHHTQKKPLAQISSELGVSETVASKYAQRHGITVKHYETVYRKCIHWLEQIMEQDNIFIQHAKNMGEYKIPGTRIHVDGFCEQTNTVYEFYGDFWHGNPQIFSSNYYNTACYKTADELYQRTLQREKIIIEQGYKLVTMWENNYDLMFLSFCRKKPELKITL